MKKTPRELSAAVEPITCQACGFRKDNPVCSHDLSLDEIDQIRRSLHFETGEVIFHTGEHPAGLYSVREGLVKLEVYAKSGAAYTVRLIGPGGIFGHRSLFSDEPAHATAVALESTDICLLPREQVVPLILRRPEMSRKLLAILADGVKAAEEKWLHQLDLGAVERIAEALVFLNSKFPGVKWTRREIAQWAGTTPETVIRTLAQFEKEGLIDQNEGRNIRILDLPGLQKKFQ